MSLYFIQHGKTRSSERGFIAPNSETLAPSGIIDAEKAGGAVLALLGGKRPDRILASPIARAWQTAEIVADTTGLDRTDIEGRDELGPRGMGTVLDTPTKAEGIPWDNEEALSALGIESLDDLAARHNALFSELTGKESTKHTVLVGHSSSIRILGRLAGLSADQIALARGDVLTLR